MTRQNRKGMTGLAIGFALVALMLFGMHGCGDRQAAPPQPPAAATPACLPGASFCPAPTLDAPAGNPPDFAVMGKLAEPVRNAKVLICDENRSDPRVIVMDVPAGTVLVKEESAR